MLGELGCSPGKGKLSWDLINVYEHLMEGCLKKISQTILISALWHDKRQRTSAEIKDFLFKIRNKSKHTQSYLYSVGT